MTEEEVELVKLMVQIIVRYPDGLERIHARLLDVIEAGFELEREGYPLPKLH